MANWSKTGVLKLRCAPGADYVVGERAESTVGGCGFKRLGKAVLRLQINLEKDSLLVA